MNDNEVPPTPTKASTSSQPASASACRATVRQLRKAGWHAILRKKSVSSYTWPELWSVGSRKHKIFYLRGSPKPAEARYISSIVQVIGQEEDLAIGQEEGLAIVHDLEMNLFTDSVWCGASKSRCDLSIRFRHNRNNNNTNNEPEDTTTKQSLTTEEQTKIRMDQARTFPFLGCFEVLSDRKSVEDTVAQVAVSLTEQLRMLRQAADPSDTDACLERCVGYALPVGGGCAKDIPFIRVSVSWNMDRMQFEVAYEQIDIDPKSPKDFFETLVKEYIRLEVSPQRDFWKSRANNSRISSTDYVCKLIQAELDTLRSKLKLKADDKVEQLPSRDSMLFKVEQDNQTFYWKLSPACKDVWYVFRGDMYKEYKDFLVPPSQMEKFQGAKMLQFAGHSQIERSRLNSNLVWSIVDALNQFHIQTDHAHLDVRLRNMVLDEQCSKVLLIDLDRAKAKDTMVSAVRGDYNPSIWYASAQSDPFGLRAKNWEASQLDWFQLALALLSVATNDPKINKQDVDNKAKKIKHKATKQFVQTLLQGEMPTKRVALQCAAFGGDDDQGVYQGAPFSAIRVDGTSAEDAVGGMSLSDNAAN